MVFLVTIGINDSIWIFVHRLTKSSHLLPVKVSYSAEDYDSLYIKEIVNLHVDPLWIISDRGSQFTSHFWRSFQKGLSTRVKLRTTFQPRMDCQAKCTIQTLEGMLRVCVLVFKGNWDEHLPLKEFSYINSYYWSISIAPFEALYVRMCSSLV